MECFVAASRYLLLHCLTSCVLAGVLETSLSILLPFLWSWGKIFLRMKQRDQKGFSSMILKSLLSFLPLYFFEIINSLKHKKIFKNSVLHQYNTGTMTISLAKFIVFRFFINSWKYLHLHWNFKIPYYKTAMVYYKLQCYKLQNCNGVW